MRGTEELLYVHTVHKFLAGIFQAKIKSQDNEGIH
jgi:hypothetical protein